MGFLAALLRAVVCVSLSEAPRADPLRLRRTLAGVRADCPVGFTVPRLQCLWDSPEAAEKAARRWRTEPPPML